MEKLWWEIVKIDPTLKVEVTKFDSLKVTGKESSTVTFTKSGYIRRTALNHHTFNGVSWVDRFSWPMYHLTEDKKRSYFFTIPEMIEYIKERPHLLQGRKGYL
jgi:hypothetical protein